MDAVYKWAGRSTLATTALVTWVNFIHAQDTVGEFISTESNNAWSVGTTIIQYVAGGAGIVFGATAYKNLFHDENKKSAGIWKLVGASACLAATGAAAMFGPDTSGG